MSNDTPRTDAEAFDDVNPYGVTIQVVPAEFARILELELTASSRVVFAASQVSENTGQSDCPTLLLVKLQEAFEQWDATCAG